MKQIPITNDTFFHVGMKVSTPDTDSGVVYQVDGESRVYVMWGDNNRKAYSFRDAQGFTIQGRRWYQVFRQDEFQRWHAEGYKTSPWDHARDVYFNRVAFHPEVSFRIAEVTVGYARHIRWVTSDEIEEGTPAK